GAGGAGDRAKRVVPRTSAILEIRAKLVPSDAPAPGQQEVGEHAIELIDRHRVVVRGHLRRGPAALLVDVVDGPVRLDVRREQVIGGACRLAELQGPARGEDRKSTRLNSSHVKISYAVFCLK